MDLNTMVINNKEVLKLIRNFSKLSPKKSELIFLKNAPPELIYAISEVSVESHKRKRASIEIVIHET